MNTAVVMAGGRGTRLWPLTVRLPKAMIPLDGRPILEFVVAALRTSGITRVLAVLQHWPSSVVEHFGDGSQFGVAMDYLLQEGDLGTAGSIRQAAEVFDDEEFVVASSDVVFHADLLPGVEFHRARRSAATLALARVVDPADLGVALVAADGRIAEFQEKPALGEFPSAAVNAGVYFLDRRALDLVPAGQPFDFGRDLFPAMARSGGAIYGWSLPGYWRDVGTLAALEAARRDVAAVPALRNLATRWPTAARKAGGRIWVSHPASGKDRWIAIDAGALARAVQTIWERLAGAKRGAEATVASLEGIRGIGKDEARAALGWLEREGKVDLAKEGDTVRVSPAPGGSPPAQR